MTDLTPRDLLTGSKHLMKVSKRVPTSGMTVKYACDDFDTKINGRYTISVGGVVRHPNLSADSAVGAMAHYLHGAEWALMKAAK